MLNNLFFIVLALSSCICLARNSPSYNADLPSPPDEVLGIKNLKNPFNRVKRMIVVNESEIEKFNRCEEHVNHGIYSHPRLLFIWPNEMSQVKSLRKLRRILANDLKLSELIYRIRRVKALPNQLYFEMFTNVEAYEVLRNYCKISNKITEYRSNGYNDKPLTYEIQLAD